MSDPLSQALLEKLSTRQVTGEHLEVLGKNAAASWASGRHPNLTEACVSAVKTAGLSTEQVKRVVEFANTAAYLDEFRKEGSHRVIDFGAGGPASPSQVLQELNYSPDPSHSASSDSSDYHSPPPSTKTASAPDEEAFGQMFFSSGAEYPEANPLGEAIDLREKLSAAYEATTGMLSTLENTYDDLRSRIFGHVKQAAMEGHSLSEIVQIWSQIAPSPDHIKVAFSELMPMLVDNGVFQDHAQVADSLSKVAHVGLVNPEHPLVGDFSEFCETLSKLAEAREAQQELGEGAARLTAFLKESAERGFLQHAGDALEFASRGAGKGTEWVARQALGNESGAVKPLSEAARLGVKYVVPALAAHEAYRATLKHNPTFQRARHAFAGMIPGTQEYYQKELELQARAQGY